MKPVFDRNGICRYLVKYLTKAAFPDHLLAVLYRKRLWGRSETPSRKKSSGWSILETVEIPKDGGEREIMAVRPTAKNSQWSVTERAWQMTGTLKGRWVQWILTTQEVVSEENEAIRRDASRRTGYDKDHGETGGFDLDRTAA
jgi:hypothetical protein